MNHNQPSARQLAHVLWVGGTPCSGKTSIANMLAEKYRMQAYHCDEAFERHKPRISAMRKVLTMSWDEIWMRPLDVLVKDVLAIYHEEIQMILDDLNALPSSATILAEGMALLPELVAPLLSNARRAVWIMPTPDFVREHYPQRGAWVQEILQQCANPSQAFQNWMERDIACARILTAEARQRKLQVIHVDGGEPIGGIAAAIEDRFRPFLPQHAEDAL